MPKAKPRKAIKSKFKITATGKLLYRKAGKRHILSKKTAKRKRAMRQAGVLSESFSAKFKRIINGL